MTAREILDSELIPNKKEPFFEIVNWWERKRLIYNTIIIAIELFLMIFFWKGTLGFGLVQSFIWSLAYTIVANGFFSIGWGLEILFNYYLKTKASEKLRMVFFVLGVVFSSLLTATMYFDALKGAHHIWMIE